MGKWDKLNKELKESLAAMTKPDWTKWDESRSKNRLLKAGKS